jgi:hypothetical protein
MRVLISLIIFTIISIPVFSQQEEQLLTDEEILEFYDGLRVADVSDGMDIVGLMDVGLLDQNILLP